MKEFKIELETFCRYYKLSHDAQKRIAEFLCEQNRSAGIPLIYIGFISRQASDIRKSLIARLPDVKKWRLEKYLTAPIITEMINQINTLPDIIEFGRAEEKEKGISAVNAKTAWNYFPLFDGFNFSNGVILNQYFLLDYSYKTHQPIFRFIFANIFEQTSYAESFLEYHFNSTFRRNTTKYTLFLHTVAKEYKTLIANGRSLWDMWITVGMQPSSASAPTPKKFENLLTEEGGAILPFLKGAYSGNRPVTIAIMLIALKQLKYLIHPFKGNVTMINKLIQESSFGYTGRPQTLNATILKFDNNDPRIRNKVAIEVTKIKSYANNFFSQEKL